MLDKHKFFKQFLLDKHKFFKQFLLDKHKFLKQFSKLQTTISENTLIIGKLFSHGSTKIDGKFNGELISEHGLIVSETGEVFSNVKTENAVIAGVFKGVIVSTGQVEITSCGKFNGNIVQKKESVIIDEGGQFKGGKIILNDAEIY